MLTMNKNLYRFGALCGPLYVFLVVLGNDALSNGPPTRQPALPPSASGGAPTQ